jgi:hypothetical protein
MHLYAQEMASSYSAVAGLGGGLFFAGLGIVAVGLAVVVLRRGTASRRWPHTEGTVEHCEVDADGSPVWIRYVYRVHDIEYHAGGVSYGDDPQTQKGWQRLAQRYPLGSRVRVYYDPDHPRRAVLEPGISIAGVIAAAVLLVTGVFFTAGGLSLFFASL